MTTQATPSQNTLRTPIDQLCVVRDEGEDFARDFLAKHNSDVVFVELRGYPDFSYVDGLLDVLTNAEQIDRVFVDPLAAARVLGLVLELSTVIDRQAVEVSVAAAS